MANFTLRWLSQDEAMVGSISPVIPVFCKCINTWASRLLALQTKGTNRDFCGGIHLVLRKTSTMGLMNHTLEKPSALRWLPGQFRQSTQRYIFEVQWEEPDSKCQKCSQHDHPEELSFSNRLREGKRQWRSQDKHQLSIFEIAASLLCDFFDHGLLSGSLVSQSTCYSMVKGFLKKLY